MNMSYRAGMFLLCLSCCLLPIFAQQQPGSAPAAGQLATGAAKHLVLDVTVTGRSGNAIKGLEEKDFTVLDNGHPQSILSFQATGGVATADLQPAVKIVLLVDEVNTNFNRVSYERDRIEKFLQQNNGVLAHSMSMAFFSDTGTEISDQSTRDGKSLLAAFDQHETALRSIRRSQGIYGAVERFQLSLNTLNSLVAKEAPVPGRKIVIWISPGWPILSGPNIELTAKNQAALFASVISVSTALRDARVTLYSVNPEGSEDAATGQTTYYEEFVKPVTTANKVLAGNLALQVLAVQSGGLVLLPSNDIEGQINRCVVDADAFYTLTLDMAQAERPNEFHAIQVKVATPGLIVRTRDGYYVQP
jgi:VWFA-related protein